MKKNKKEEENTPLPEGAVEVPYKFDKELEPDREYMIIPAESGPRTIIQWREWGPERSGLLIESVHRTDNGPGASHGTTKFLEDGTTHPITVDAWCSGGRCSKEYPYRLVSGQTPRPTRPGRAWHGDLPQRLGRDFCESSSKDEQRVIICLPITRQKTVEYHIGWWIVDSRTGIRIGQFYQDHQRAVEEMAIEDEEVIPNGPGGLPWQLRPKAWEKINTASTERELMDAIKAFPVSWRDVERVWARHPLAEKFWAFVGINYGHKSANDGYRGPEPEMPPGALIESNPKAGGLAGEGNIFVAKKDPAFDVAVISKNGRRWYRK